MRMETCHIDLCNEEPKKLKFTDNQTEPVLTATGLHAVGIEK